MQQLTAAGDPLQADKLLFHQFQLSEIPRQAVRPAMLARRYFEATGGEDFTSLHSAKVNDRGQLLLFGRRAPDIRPSGQCMNHLQVKVCGRKLNGVARQ